MSVHIDEEVVIGIKTSYKIINRNICHFAYINVFVNTRQEFNRRVNKLRYL